jgi:hypothetical protein
MDDDDDDPMLGFDGSFMGAATGSTFGTKSNKQNSTSASATTGSTATSSPVAPAPANPNDAKLVPANNSTAVVNGTLPSSNTPDSAARSQDGDFKITGTSPDAKILSATLKGGSALNQVKSKCTNATTPGNSLGFTIKLAVPCGNICSDPQPRKVFEQKFTQDIVKALGTFEGVKLEESQVSILCVLEEGDATLVQYAITLKNPSDSKAAQTVANAAKDLVEKKADPNSPASGSKLLSAIDPSTFVGEMRVTSIDGKTDGASTGSSGMSTEGIVALVIVLNIILLAVGFVLYRRHRQRKMQREQAWRLPYDRSRNGSATSETGLMRSPHSVETATPYPQPSVAPRSHHEMTPSPQPQQTTYENLRDQMYGFFQNWTNPFAAPTESQQAQVKPNSMPIGATLNAQSAPARPQVNSDVPLVHYRYSRAPMSYVQTMSGRDTFEFEEVKRPAATQHKRPLDGPSQATSRYVSLFSSASNER